MHSLPTWAIWTIVVPLVLLSPVIAFLLGMATEIVICGLWDAGTPGLVLFGAGVCALILVRRFWKGRRRPALET
jgi:ABC-type transport system involved in cytochrome c biogenesis permease component